MITCVACVVCGSICEERLISLALPRSEEGIALLRNVPAEVCTGCGETRFTLSTTGRVMAAFRSALPPDEVAMIPVYDLATAR